MFRFILLDVILVTFLKVLGKNDITILSNSMHSCLKIKQKCSLTIGNTEFFMNTKIVVNYSRLALIQVPVNRASLWVNRNSHQGIKNFCKPDKYSKMRKYQTLKKIILCFLLLAGL